MDVKGFMLRRSIVLRLMEDISAKTISRDLDYLLTVTTMDVKSQKYIQSFYHSQAQTMANFLYTFPVLFCLLLTLSWGPIPIEAQSGKAMVQQQQLWCVAKNNAEDSALQQALDWACGPGGADCGPIQNGGPCYDSNDLIDMASYAFNDYCLKHGMTDDTCNFSNTAALTALNPSHSKCKYASSTLSTPNSTTPSTAGIIPGSEDMNGCSRLSAIQVVMLALINLVLAVCLFSL